MDESSQIMSTGPILSIARHIVPSRYHTHARLGYEFMASFPSKPAVCPICNKKSLAFLPGGSRSPNNAQSQIIASGYRKHSVCPRCNSKSRHRLLWYYLNEYAVINPGDEILYVAPNDGLETVLRNVDGCHITTLDLYMDDVNIKADIQNIPFKDNKFDIVICSHVLNVVEDDIEAMNEIQRVISEDGHGFFMMPINPLSNTMENTQITNDTHNRIIFFYDTIVRLYGWDIYNRFEKCGYDVDIFFSNEVEDNLFNKYRLNSIEPIFCCTPV